MNFEDVMIVHDGLDPQQIIYRLWLLVMCFWVFYTIKGIKIQKLSKVIFTITVPFIAFLLYTYVFVWNNGSHLRKLSSTHGLWVLWHHAWFVLFFGNLVCFVASFITLFCQPYPTQNWKIFIFKFLGFLTVCLSYYFILAHIPDA